MLLSVPALTLPPSWAAAQSIELIGALVAVTVALILEATDR